MTALHDRPQPICKNLTQVNFNLFVILIDPAEAHRISPSIFLTLERRKEGFHNLERLNCTPGKVRLQHKRIEQASIIMTPITSTTTGSIDSVLLRPGTVVETTFGVGVVIASGSGSSNKQVQVQLWRLPGRSLGTATTAYLQPSAVRAGFVFMEIGRCGRNWMQIYCLLELSFLLRDGLISQLSYFFLLLPVLTTDYIIPMLPHRLPQHSHLKHDTTDFTTITSSAWNDHHH